MIHFKFTPKDTRYLFLKCDNAEDEKAMKGLIKRINLTDPICFLPTYKGPPFTQDFLWEYVQPGGEKVWFAAIGMYQPIYEYFKENNIEFDGLVENQQYFKRKLNHTFSEFKDIVDSWGLKFPPRPYQYVAAYKILQYKQSLSLLATRAGKTLIAYIIFRYAMEYMGMKRILMIVPSIDLVKQAYNDFNDYAEFFKTECVWGGGKLVESANMTVGTFQSLIKFLDKKSKKYNPHFYDGYDCVFVDETHRATAAQIKTIISQPFMKEVKLAFGMTGTLPKSHSIGRYCLHALLGAKIQEIRPKQLMDEGYIAKIHINQVRLNYNNLEKQQDLYIKCAEYALSDFDMIESVKKPGKKERVKLENPQFLLQYHKSLPYGIQAVKNTLMTTYGKHYKGKYIDTLKRVIKESTKTNMLVIEKMMVHLIPERIEYLCNNIIPKCNYNTILFCHHTEFLKFIENTLKERFPDKHIAMIHGGTGSKQRDEIKQMLKDHNDCILVASYACVGTGLTLSNLCYGILFESFKSEVINMQSMGRGLGLSDLRDKFILYDIIDVFDKKEISNKLFLQGLEKIKLYKSNEYEFEIINENINIL